MTTRFKVGALQTYTNFESALADIPSVLLDDYLIEFQDVAEYVYSAGVSYQISTGSHTVGVFNIYISAAPGKGFKDNIVAGTDALKYSPTKGVAFKNIAVYAGLLQINTNSVKLSDIQLKNDTQHGLLIDGTNSDNCKYERLIVENGSISTAAFEYGVKFYGSNSIAQNILVYCSSNGSNGLHNGAGSTIPITRFCTVVRNTQRTAAQTGFVFAYNGHLENSLSYNFATAAGTFTGSTGNNATDLSSGLPGSNNVYNLSNPFVSSLSASLDLSVVVGSALIGAGLYDADCPTDILGRTRANPPTIGCYEYISTSTNLTVSAGVVSGSYSLATTTRSLGVTVSPNVLSSILSLQNISVSATMFGQVMSFCKIRL